MMTTALTSRSLVEKYYELIDNGHVDDAMELTTEDIKFKFANAAPAVGRSATRAGIDRVLDQCNKIKHDVLTFFDIPRGDGLRDVIFELRITYDLKNGKHVSIPGCAVTTVNSDGRFVEQRLYGDLTDVFAE
ncbi:nuclear transport factor 2 family protein [Thermocrispum sp.]|uniref:nuclear transport factor 2 family protein n=1 Tax=Thermocrispum sp. TaxID=2060768 RepID=UPI00257F5536|nr:nuclear transport factor 2 family protein [Thermocrispum sp.]